MLVILDIKLLEYRFFFSYVLLLFYIMGTNFAQIAIFSYSAHFYIEETMQQRTIFSIILGTAILAISLFLLNSWLNAKNEGMFLTQETYMGTVTWYEDAQTPPVPSEFQQSSPLISSIDTNATNDDFSTISDSPSSESVLSLITANGDMASELEPEMYDIATGTFVKAPTKKDTPVHNTSVQKTNTPQKDSQTPTKPINPVKQPSTSQQNPVQTNSEPKNLNKIFLTKDTSRPLRIEASHPVTYKAFYLASPDRVVIDIDGRLITAHVEKAILKNPSIKDVRIAYNGNNTRLVVDLLKKPKDWSVIYGQRKSTIDLSLKY